MRRNIFFATIGFLIPTVVLFIAYPVFISHLGLELFGIYTLATSLSGSLAFLGFGFFSATIKFVSHYISEKDYRSAGSVLITALFYYGVVGIICGTTVWSLAPWLVLKFQVSPVFQEDGIWIFRLGGLQIIAVFLINVYLAFFKGLQKFDVSALIRSGLSIFSYGGGILAILIFGANARDIAAITLSVNIIILIAASMLCVSTCNSLKIKIDLDGLNCEMFKKMFGFGGMVAITALATIAFCQMQRYLVGYLMGASSVAIYVLAFSVASKAHALITAATEIIFPIASAIKDYYYLRRIYIKMMFGSLFAGFVILLPLGLFTDFILKLWLNNPQLSEQVTPLLKIFALAYFFLCLSPAPYHLANGLGKPGLNTINIIARAILNMTILVIFWFTGMTLTKIVWSFAITTIVVDGLIWIYLIENIIWRKWKKEISACA